MYTNFVIAPAGNFIKFATIMDSVKQGRPQQYGEELIVLHNDAVDRGVTVKPMQYIDAAQKDTIVNTILNSAV